MLSKLTSRKFWLAVAAFLASLGTSCAGLVNGNETLTVVGLVCTMLSAAIYAACEAYVDGQGASATQTIKTVTATTADKATVQQVMGTAETSTEESK